MNSNQSQITLGVVHWEENGNVALEESNTIEDVSQQKTGESGEAQSLIVSVSFLGKYSGLTPPK